MAKTKKQYTIGIDIGGTKMSGVLFDGQKVIADDLLATPKDNLDHMLVMLKALIESLEERAKQDKVLISGVGVGIAGVIDYAEGRVSESPNIEYINGAKIAEKISERLEYPVMLDNDGNCFLRAEVMLGAGRRYSNIYGVVIGTGIGGGWWYDNKIYRAVHGGSGEPAQMIIDFTDGIMLEPAYHKLMQNNPAQVAEEAYRGDVLALKTYEEVGVMLGKAFANIANLLAPELIVVGGGVVESSDLFMRKTRKTMKEYIASEEVAKRIKIVKSKLGPLAGAMGAALQFKEAEENE